MYVDTAAACDMRIFMVNDKYAPPFAILVQIGTLITHANWLFCLYRA